MSHRTAAASALPFKILLPRLAEFCIPRTLCNTLRKDAIFQKIEFRWQKIADVRDIAESQHNIPLSISALARAFESNAHEVVCNRHSSMGWIRRDIEGSILLLNRIINNKFLTGSNKTPKAARQLRKKKSRITACANFKLQSLTAG
jgi:hypothetical protein